MKRTLKFILMMMLLSFPNLFAKDIHKIQWQLENPFKFFTEKEVYWNMKKLYDESNESKYENSKGLAFERALQSKDWGIGRRYHKLGWATHFAINGYNNTCWDQSKMLYKTTGKCSNYIDPKKHNVIVELDGAKDEMCSWFVNGDKKKSNIKCSEKTTLTIPYNDKEQFVSVNIKNNSQLVTPELITVKDILIVGLGDSFASGEGNPDLPIETHNMIKNPDWILTKDKYLPRKKKGNSAKWIDRRAHRSLYSYQFKTALQYSLDNPKNSITFVSFSSSSAKTKHILNKKKKEIEKSKYVKKKIRPQIELLKDTIGNREIDILLLSIGGNDIGFAGYVQNILFKTGSSKKPKKTKTEKKLWNTLSKNYRKLDNILKKYIKDANSKRILLTAYPNPLYDESGKNICDGNRGAMKIPFGVTAKRKTRISNTHEYLIKPLYNIQKKLAKELNWSFVDNHRSVYRKHGFCSKNFNSSIQEQFVAPHIINHKWKPFNPKEYVAYARKQRWFQLPVDALLMTNVTRDWLGIRIDLLFSDETSGIFHPTADGLSVTADANVKLIYERFPELNNTKGQK